MNNFIKESGKLYSIYNDNTLEDLEQKYLDQFYRIMSFENELTLQNITCYLVTILMQEDL